MTTEDDFQAALDAHPDDWQTRLVFADWLEERGDPRAEGYRALGAHQFRPHDYGEPMEAWRRWAWFRSALNSTPGYYTTGALCWYWWDALCGASAHPTRRAAEDAAALAFAELPPERRAKLLTPA